MMQINKVPCTCLSVSGLLRGQHVCLSACLSASVCQSVCEITCVCVCVCVYRDEGTVSSSAESEASVRRDAGVWARLTDHLCRRGSVSGAPGTRQSDRGARKLPWGPTHTHTHVSFYGLQGLSIGGMVFKLYFLSPNTNPTPKPTTHRKLCAFFGFPKKHHLLCFFFKPFELWGH